VSHFAVIINGSTGTSVTQNIEGVSSVCRLFYAGACEGQMPEILTMIQIKKLTPTPAVLCMVRVIFSSAVKHHDSILSCLLSDMSQFLTLDVVTYVPSKFADSSQAFVHRKAL
jgi:hypothetical protein